MIVRALRREPKADGIGDVELARRLGVSHASGKRWLAGGSFTLTQLGHILRATGIGWLRIATASATEEHLPDQLSWQQEAELVADPKRLLVAVAAMNHLGVAEMTPSDTLTEAECVQHLLALDGMRLLTPMPGNRVDAREKRKN